MITFDGITIIVKNIEKQRDFYENILGLELLSDYGSAVFFKLGEGRKLGLFTLGHHSEGTASLEGASKGISHFEFGVSTEKSQEIEKRLREKGFHAYGDNYKDADGNLFHFNYDGKIAW